MVNCQRDSAPTDIKELKNDSSYYLVYRGTTLSSILGMVCGFKGKLSVTEVDRFMQDFEGRGATQQQLENLRYFLEHDDGKEWFMVNAMTLKHPEAKSFKLLDQYVRAFMSGVDSRAGHPMFISRALAAILKIITVIEADHWTIAAIIRYRSRRDGAYIMLDTLEVNTMILS